MIDMQIRKFPNHPAVWSWIWWEERDGYIDQLHGALIRDWIYDLRDIDLGG